MAADERTTWLEGLKQGDQVVVENSRGTTQQIETVVRRTAGGRIIVTMGRGEITFNPDGLERTSTTAKARLEPLTDAIRDEIERKRLITRAEMVPWKQQSLETLRAVLALVEQAASENK